eukprot:UN06124
MRRKYGADIDLAWQKNRAQKGAKGIWAKFRSVFRRREIPKYVAPAFKNSEVPHWAKRVNYLLEYHTTSFAVIYFLYEA